MSEVSGFVNIIKPTGLSSSAIVVKVKKILGTKKVGHLGTLDPAASGVLPLAVGRCTKFFDYFLSKDKVYRALVKFGVETDTLDGFGTILEKSEKKVSCEDVKNILNEFVGEILQTPPKYSAIKINGKKAYDLARDNVKFEIKPRKIDIFSIDLIEESQENLFLFEVHCSAGTYIRTLFSDIAHRLGTISTTVAIIRTKSGSFEINDAITLEELEKSKNIIGVKDIFKDLKTFDFGEQISKKLIVGQRLKVNEFGVDFKDNQEFFAEFEGKLIGFYKVCGENVKQVVYLL